MSNLSKLEFTALDISGNNYLPWTLDAKIHLTANNLGETIIDGNQTSPQDQAKAMIFLRDHLHEDLKREYLTVGDPLELWTNIKERFDHQKLVLLPKARYEWLHLRLQDFKTVSEYNSELKLCGEKLTDEDMLEKSFSTLYATNMLRSQQYREQTLIGTTSSVSNLIKGSGRAQITLSSGTQLSIDNALYSSRSRRNLLSFKDNRKNGYHLKTIAENKIEYLQITSSKNGQETIVEQLEALSSGLYCTNINPMESYMLSNQKLLDKDTFNIWHDRLGHLVA
ncbi:uncharacterized protein LOC110933036 [Helianthus annuus]|uniref:uncharacterized protein LOC110933036 n=1 Tax=Helianthus annuus TaxID=4232 RepID=UPI000B8F759B|nr:uncharacterized protein LOC110933036 [Helianthus annuus]